MAFPFLDWGDKFLLYPADMKGCFLSLLAIILCAGCTISRTFFATADCDYKRVRLRAWAAHSARENGTIRVLLVHGMNNHPFGFSGGKPNLFGCATYADLQTKLSGPLDSKQLQDLHDLAVGAQFDTLIQALAQQLGASHEEERPDSFTIIPGGDGRAIGYIFTRSFSAAKSGRRALKFYVANWALSACVEKERQFGGWSSSTGDRRGDRDFDPALEAQRAPLNKLLKRQTIDWGLGDASLYLSDKGGKFRDVVNAAIRRIRSETDRHDRIAIISASLGSTIALDCIPTLFRSDAAKALFTTPDRMAESPRQARAVFYMFANQFALLSIGRPQDEDVNSLVKLDRELGRSKATVQVYAFSDPNDLLSLPLNTKLKNVSICNVYVRNPGITLGIAMNPGDAHVNYERNSHVIATLLDGPEKAPTRPDDCR